MTPQTLLGMRVFVSPDVPRYVLPERLSLPCGVDIEWPAGFRDDINLWSLSFLGTTNAIPDGQVLMVRGGDAHANPRTYWQMRAQLQSVFRV